MVPVVIDVNVFVSAVVGGSDDFHAWPSPPPVRGSAAANVVGIINDAREFSLFLSEHILVNIGRVLASPDAYAWDPARVEEYVELLVEIADASGGGVLEPQVTVSDRDDFEDNRILECALAGNAMLLVSDDVDLLSLSPWRGTPVVTSRDFVARTDASRRAKR